MRTRTHSRKTGYGTIFVVGPLYGDYEKAINMTQQVAAYPSLDKTVVFMGDYMGTCRPGDNSRIADLISEVGQFHSVVTLYGSRDKQLEAIINGLQGMPKGVYQSLKNLNWEPGSAQEEVVWNLLDLAGKEGLGEVIAHYEEWPLTSNPRLMPEETCQSEFVTGHIYIGSAGSQPSNTGTLRIVEAKEHTKHPVIKKDKISLDTGAGRGGYLSAAVFNGRRLRELLTAGHPKGDRGEYQVLGGLAA